MRSRPHAHTRAREVALLGVLLASGLLAAACGGSSSATTQSASRGHTAGVTTTAAVGVPNGPQHTKRGITLAPATQRALYRYAACMRAKGVSMPQPNIDGPGPVFDPKRVDTKSPSFTRASGACRATLLAETQALTGSSTR